MNIMTLFLQMIDPFFKIKMILKHSHNQNLEALKEKGTIRGINGDKVFTDQI